MTEKHDRAVHPGKMRKPGRKFYVFLISLLIASGFWLLNALSKNYTEEIPVRITYSNIPEGKTFSQPATKEISVVIEGDGYSLIQLKRALRKEMLQIDLSECSFEDIDRNRERGIIPSWMITDQLLKDIGGNVNINKLSVDSLIVVVEDEMIKELTVKPAVDVVIAKGYVLQSEPLVEPQTVEVTGPVSQLKEMDTIATEFFRTEPLSEPVAFELALNPPATVRPLIDKVKVHLDVEPLTEGTFRIRLKVKNLPPGVSLRLIPPEVEVKFTTGLSVFDQVSPSQFSATVDYRDVKENLSKLPVSLDVVPPGATVLIMDPDRVSYLIMENQ